MKLKSYVINVNSKFGSIEATERQINSILQQDGFELVSFEMNDRIAIIIGRVNEGQKCLGKPEKILKHSNIF